MRSSKPMRQQVTVEVIMSAGWDAGNRSMESAGRRTWNEDDYNAAVRETERLYGIAPAAPGKEVGRG